MDFKKVVNSLMTMGTTKSSSKTCKTIFSRNGIFQSSSLGLKLIVILQIIFIQINIHSVTGKFKAYHFITSLFHTKIYSMTTNVQKWMDFIISMSFIDSILLQYFEYITHKGLKTLTKSIYGKKKK